MPMCASTINTAHTAAIKAPLRPKSIVCPHRKPLLSPTQGEERGGGPPLHPSLYIFFLSLNPFLLITKFPDPAVQRTGATSDVLPQKRQRRAGREWGAPSRSPH